MRVITWDLEIAEPVPQGRDGKLDWNVAKRGECGVSSVALYDTDTERFHVYDPLSMERCIDHLNKADLLVGFNSVEFDYPCLTGYTGLPVYPPHYDILQDIWDALGPGNRGHGVWGLGAVCERTLGLQKNFSGAGAPQLYAEGRYAELFDYNINDVHITRRLANYIHTNGCVLRPNGQSLKLRGPGSPC